MKKTDRPIDMIVIHCAATPPDMDIGVEEIDRWHKERGWSGIGYHYVIRRNGILEDGRDVSKAGAHVKGYNSKSIGICLVGGVDASNHQEDNFTPKQYRTLSRLTRGLKAAYGVQTVCGHRDLDSGKACPSFDVAAWLKKENI